MSSLSFRTWSRYFPKKSFPSAFKVKGFPQGVPAKPSACLPLPMYWSLGFKGSCRLTGGPLVGGE